MRLAAAIAGLFAASAENGGDIIKGSQIYARHCAACHGPAGVSVMPSAPNLSRGERMMQPDMALLVALKSGRNGMPAYAGILNDREILDVISYSRTLRK
jgi:cytochrome c6